MRARAGGASSRPRSGPRACRPSCSARRPPGSDGGPARRGVRFASEQGRDRACCRCTAPLSRRADYIRRPLLMPTPSLTSSPAPRTIPSRGPLVASASAGSPTPPPPQRRTTAWPPGPARPADADLARTGRALRSLLATLDQPHGIVGRVEGRSGQPRVRPDRLLAAAGAGWIRSTRCTGAGPGHRGSSSTASDQEYDADRPGSQVAMLRHQRARSAGPRCTTDTADSLSEELHQLDRIGLPKTVARSSRRPRSSATAGAAAAGSPPARIERRGRGARRSRAR